MSSQGFTSHCSCHFSMQVFFLCFFFFVQRQTPQISHQDEVLAFSSFPSSVALQHTHLLSCFLPALSCTVIGQCAFVVDNQIVLVVSSMLNNSNSFLFLLIFFSGSICKTCLWKCIFLMAARHSTQFNFKTMA